MPTLAAGKTWTATEDCTVKMMQGYAYVRPKEGEDVSLRQGMERDFMKGDKLAAHPEGCQFETQDIVGRKV
jgi:uncharacterized cupin superfamily protein